MNTMSSLRHWEAIIKTNTKINPIRGIEHTIYPVNIVVRSVGKSGGEAKTLSTLL